MTEKRTLKLPYVTGLDKAGTLEEFSGLLEEKAGKGDIDIINWKGYPCRPDCRFRTGWCEAGIGILFEVEGQDLRAQALSDNGRIWEDSCCEFFISHPSDGTYYNFELNCIGTLLAAKRRSRTDCEHFPADRISLVKRFSSLEHRAYDEKDKVFTWRNGMFIPFSLIGIDGKNPPETLSANFYKCGDLTAHPHFLSWSPIDAPKPDFHRPDWFGTLIPEK